MSINIAGVPFRFLAYAPRVTASVGAAKAMHGIAHTTASAYMVLDVLSQVYNARTAGGATMLRTAIERSAFHAIASILIPIIVISFMTHLMGLLLGANPTLQAVVAIACLCFMPAVDAPTMSFIGKFFDGIFPSTTQRIPRKQDF